MTDEHVINRETFRRSGTQTTAELHITGGVRAVEQHDRHWSWYPILIGGSVKQLSPLPIQRVASLADAVGLTLFGGDQQSGLEGPLVSRVWTPLNGANSGGLQPADVWRAIAGNAHKAGDTDYALLARHLSYSLTAAGIRLRDTSDDHHAQLTAAIERREKSGARFANIPLQNLQLAFHSVLSELASARDYIAASLAQQLGAPAKIDAMNRFKEWVTADSRAHMTSGPVVSVMLAAYDATSADPWLHHLTEYRNLYLHRQPLGSTPTPQFLIYETVEHDGFTFPRISMPLDTSDPSAPGMDALTRFIQLYRAMTSLVKLAADHTSYDANPPTFVVK